MKKYSTIQIILSVFPQMNHDHAKALAETINHRYRSHKGRIAAAQRMANKWRANREAALKANRADARALG